MKSFFAKSKMTLIMAFVSLLVGSFAHAVEVGDVLDYAGKKITVVEVRQDGSFICKGNWLNFPHPMLFDRNGNFLGSTYVGY